MTAMHVLATRVLLAPSDFDRSVDFYEHRLGLARYREWGAPGWRGVVYFLGGGYLELSEGATARPVSGVRLWLQVADAHAAHDELVNAGITVAEPPERRPWGLVEMVLEDPDGLQLVVVEVPEDHPLRRDTRT